MITLKKLDRLKKMSWQASGNNAGPSSVPVVPIDKQTAEEDPMFTYVSFINETLMIVKRVIHGKN